MYELPDLDPYRVKNTSWLGDCLARLVRAGKDELGVGVVHGRLLLINGLLSFLPYLGAKRIRTALYRLAGFQIGPKTVIYGKLRLWGNAHLFSNLRIGRSCRINIPCSIDLNAPVILGDRVVFGYGVTIITGSHDMSAPSCRAGALVIRPVTIGDGVWVAANVTILPGVTIGEGAVIGAGSVVTRDVLPHTLVAGNPARFVRQLTAGTHQ